MARISVRSRSGLGMAVVAVAVAGMPSPAGAADTMPTASLTAKFADRQVDPGDTSVLTFTITNEGPRVLRHLGFVQPLPKDLVVTAYGLRKDCGGGVMVSGVHAVRTSDLNVAPATVCTVEVVVSPTVEGMFEVSPQKNATITGNLIPGQGDVLRVRQDPTCESALAAVCSLPMRPAPPPR
ncbi:MAG TPA: hypothetical protein VGL04_07890 [Sporichthyaceae bacterium]